MLKRVRSGQRWPWWLNSNSQWQVPPPPSPPPTTTTMTTTTTTVAATTKQQQTTTNTHTSHITLSHAWTDDKMLQAISYSEGCIFTLFLVFSVFVPESLDAYYIDMYKACLRIARIFVLLFRRHNLTWTRGKITDLQYFSVCLRTLCCLVFFSATNNT